MKVKQKLVEDVLAALTAMLESNGASAGNIVNYIGKSLNLTQDEQLRLEKNVKLAIVKCMKKGHLVEKGGRFFLNTEANAVQKVLLKGQQQDEPGPSENKDAPNPEMVSTEDNPAVIGCKRRRRKKRKKSRRRKRRRSLSRGTRDLAARGRRRRISVSAALRIALRKIRARSRSRRRRAGRRRRSRSHGRRRRRPLQEDGQRRDGEDAGNDRTAKGQEASPRRQHSEHSASNRQGENLGGGMPPPSTGPNNTRTSPQQNKF